MINQPYNQSTQENPVGRFMVAVGAVIQLRGTEKILVVKRSSKLDWQPGEWEMIYGRLDQHEDPEVGLKREILEEVGIKDLIIHQPIRIWQIYRGSVKSAKNDLIGITYTCSTESSSIKLSAEHTDYKWVTPQKALKLIKVKGIKKDIEAWFRIKNKS